MADSLDTRSGVDESDWRPQRDHSRISMRLVDASAPRSGNLVWWIFTRRLTWLMNDYVVVASVGVLFAGLANSEPLLFRSALLLSLFMTAGCFFISATLPSYLRRLGLAEELFASPVAVRHFEEALGSVLTLCRMHWGLLVVATFAGGVTASFEGLASAGVSRGAFASAVILILMVCLPVAMIIMALFLDFLFWSNVRWGFPFLGAVAAGAYGIQALIGSSRFSTVGSVLGFFRFWTILLFPAISNLNVWKKYRLVESLKERSGVD